MSSRWTDEDISTLVRMWPTNSVTRIANRLHRSPDATRERARRLLKQGLLEGTITSHNKINGGRSTTNPIKPDPQDFDEVKGDYCRKHHITIAQIYARFEGDDRLVAELYGLPVHRGRAHPRSYGHQITREDLRRPCSPPSSLAAFWYGASTVSPVDTSPRTSLVGRFREG
jgi:DNA-binding Lrp family transcriptional regulator